MRWWRRVGRWPSVWRKRPEPPQPVAHRLERHSVTLAGIQAENTALRSELELLRHQAESAREALALVDADRKRLAAAQGQSVAEQAAGIVEDFRQRAALLAYHWRCEKPCCAATSQDIARAIYQEPTELTGHAPPCRGS